MNSIFIGVSVVYALLCAAPAAMKLSGSAHMRTAAEHFGIPWNRYRAIGLLEAAAAVGIIAGIFRHSIGFASALGMVALLIGAVIFHRRAKDRLRESVAALVFLSVSAAYLGVWLVCIY